MGSKYTIGLDYGTNSVRTVIVDVANGEEIASFVWNYSRGQDGILVDERDPNIARQHPMDYVEGLEKSVEGALAQAKSSKGFSAEDIIGIGFDTTGSTPMPIDKDGIPLAFQEKFADNLNAMAWLWKDHTSFAEASEITELAKKIRPHYLAKIGGTYSSEWFWAKILNCLRRDAKVFAAAHTWVEYADWLPAMITGNSHPSKLKRGICAAGHKGLFHPSWGGYPEPEFLAELNKKLVKVREALPNTAYTVADAAGQLSEEWAGKLGLQAGIPVAVGAFDAHLGGVGSGIEPGILVKNIGTSTCDMMVAPLSSELPDIPGLCGIVPGSILPGYYGMEAGQSAVGDIFNWFVSYIQPGGGEAGSHNALREKAEKLKPGESGLLSLDWHNGNRTILVDQRLTGLILGLNLHTRPEEIYRALIEATAFGARIIMERFEEYGVKVKRIVNCGGIAVKDPLLMQIYADVMGRNMEISRSTQTGALGSAIAGSVVAGKEAGGHANFGDAIGKMTGVLGKAFKPKKENVRVYDELFKHYKALHDALGTPDYDKSLYNVMKDLLSLRDKARS